MTYFVHKDSIARRIWGSADTILFVFAGASAEFALNKAVDWLYFTGKLPADPVGRLFSTVVYARKIVFSENEKALNVIDRMASIHSALEASRKEKIPDWAYRDVLFMLIHYSIASFELLHRNLSLAEKEDLFDVFFRVGKRMNLKDLPGNYTEWTKVHQEHLQQDLAKSNYTIDLYNQYRKHLGLFRYGILIESQKLVCPTHVCQLMGFGKVRWILPLVTVYKVFRKLKLDHVLKSLVLPAKYEKEIRELDKHPD